MGRNTKIDDNVSTSADGHGVCRSIVTVKPANHPATGQICAMDPNPGRTMCRDVNIQCNDGNYRDSDKERCRKA